MVLPLLFSCLEKKRLQWEKFPKNQIQPCGRKQNRWPVLKENCASTARARCNGLLDIIKNTVVDILVKRVPTIASAHGDVRNGALRAGKNQKENGGICLTRRGGICPTEKNDARTQANSKVTSKESSGLGSREILLGKRVDTGPHEQSRNGGEEEVDMRKKCTRRFG